MEGGNAGLPCRMKGQDRDSEVGALGVDSTWGGNSAGNESQARVWGSVNESLTQQATEASQARC